MKHQPDLKKFLTFATAIALWALWTPSIFASDSYFVRSPIGNGADDASAMTDLVATELRKLGNEVTQNPSGADYEIQPKALRMGSAYVFTLEKIQSGKVIKAEQLKASKLEEMDSILSRLTRVVVKESSAESEMKHKDISDEEISRTNRRLPSKSASYFDFGGSFASKWNPKGFIPSFALGRAWDLDRAILALEVQSAVSSVGSYWQGALGGRYLFSNSDFSPFLGAGFGYGVLFESTFSAVSGFALTAQTGVHLFRLSSVNLVLALRYSTILGLERQTGAPAVWMLSLGFLY